MVMEKIPALEEDLGGESACYAHLVCAECGAVLDEHHHELGGACAESVNKESMGDATRN
jgi:Fe2+ or Zn2+ uptake regulation protein